MQTYTFLPKSGAIYSGEVEDINNMGFDNEYMASFSKKPQKYEWEGTVSPEAREYVANALKKNSRSKFVLTDVRKDLYKAQVLKQQLAHLQNMARGKGQFNADVQSKIIKAYNQYKAVANGDNVQQLTIVQFVNQIVGHLEQPSYIAAAFQNITLDKLRGKIPEMGWPDVQIQVQRLSEPEISATEYGQTEFRIFRNDVHIFTSREDRMEAVIDPHATSISQGQIQMMRARELLALKQLAVDLVHSGTYGDIPDITAGATNQAPRSTNDAPAAFVGVMVKHFRIYKNYLKYFVWNPEDYRAYLSNWFTHGYTELQVPEGFGVVPFKGLEKYGAVAIISPYVPRSFVYSVASEGAYELDGPYIVDAEYEAKKFADYNIIHDFIGYKIMNPKRFGEKLYLLGITPETEITTNKQVYDNLKAPKDIVVKNAKA